MPRESVKDIKKRIELRHTKPKLLPNNLGRRRKTNEMLKIEHELGDSIENIIVGLRNKGSTIDEIGAALEVNRTTVYRWMDKLGIGIE